MIAVFFALLVLNGLFALSEMALISTRKARLQKWVDDGDKGALVAEKLAEDPASFLAAIQIGLISIAILNGILGEELFAAPIGAFLQRVLPALPIKTANGLGTAASVIFITYVTIVIGELTPKRLGQLNPEGLARIVSRPIYWFSRITRPGVVFLTSSTHLVLRLMGIRHTNMPAVTHEEIHALLVEGSESGVIDEQEHQMVRNVFRLDDRKIISLMVPRLDVTWLSVNDPIQVTLDKIASSQYSRFPVCGDSINDVMGIVMAKTVLAHALEGKTVELESIMKPPLYVPESLNGMELLNALRNSQTEMAFVVDEYGDIQGIVTIQDVVEAITGEFATPNDKDSWSIQREDGSWLLDGLIPTDNIKDLLDIKHLPEEERGVYNTLSGMMMLQLGRIPQTTDIVDWDGWRFEIVDMDGKRIDKVLVSQLPHAPFHIVEPEQTLH